MMQYTFNCLRGRALGQILPHVRVDRTIGLKNVPALTQLWEAAFGDPDRVATPEWTMPVIKQMSH
jgi:hypothetical protein